MTKENIIAEVQAHLSTMAVPEGRKELTTNNIRWLLRNLGIQNSAHPEFHTVMGCLKVLIKMET